MAAAPVDASVLVFDRNAFQTKLTVPALRVPKQKCHELMKRCKGLTLDRPKVRCIANDGDSDATKLLLLEERLLWPAGQPPAPELQALLAEHPGLQLLTHELVFGYSALSSDQVLRALLPAKVEVPTSFEAVGHIAHLNLREEHLPYRHLIGQVLLDKNPNLRTIVNKLGSIENEFRVFRMEVIAGEPCFETEVVQHGSRFKLDFSQVYWNSRLETEHKRLVGLFTVGDVIADIMAGIGPFAVPAAQKGCTVYANDLNPSSAHYLRVNARLNKIDRSVHAFNMDGRAFVRMLCATAEAAAGDCEQQQHHQQQLQEQQQPEPQRAEQNGAQQQEQQQRPTTSVPTSVPQQQPQLPSRPVYFKHAVMNLPASAVEFLDAYRGAFDPRAWKGRLPMVHCYTFMKAPEKEADVIAKVERYLGGPLDAPPAIHVVRDVAPSKLMLCVSFRVPEAVAFHGWGEHEGASAAAGASVAAVSDAATAIGGGAADAATQGVCGDQLGAGRADDGQAASQPGQCSGGTTVGSVQADGGGKAHSSEPAASMVAADAAVLAEGALAGGSHKRQKTEQG